jgi:hypothetical protein
MADQERDLKVPQGVSQAYRELGAEEPPRALDDAILAAARRETRSHPAPLVAPTGRRSWLVPVAAAAVLVLAVAVTLHMQIEQPDIESPSQRVDSSPPPAKITAPDALQSAPASSAPVAEARARRQKSAEAPRASEPRPFLAEKAPAAAPPPVAAAPSSAPAPAPSAELSSRADEGRGVASNVTGAIARQAEERTSRDAEAAARAPQAGPVQALAKRAPAQGGVQAETPERELERIAELRRQGRHDDADRALAEFRKRYPDYRISEAMRERVERR